jgi:hypothetical protein
MQDDDGGIQYFQQLGLLQEFNEIFNLDEVTNYEHSYYDFRSIRHWKIHCHAQHESR